MFSYFHYIPPDPKSQAKNNLIYSPIFETILTILLFTTGYILFISFIHAYIIIYIIIDNSK